MTSGIAGTATATMAMTMTMTMAMTMMIMTMTTMMSGAIALDDGIATRASAMALRAVTPATLVPVVAAMMNLAELPEVEGARV